MKSGLFAYLFKEGISFDCRNYKLILPIGQLSGEEMKRVLELSTVKHIRAEDGKLVLVLDESLTD